MTELEQNKLHIVEKEETVANSGKTQPKQARQTNPILRKMAAFHQDKAEVFSVKDLFKH